MKISGLQKVSVIDYPGEIACIIFLHGCNFRCGFCYNSDLVVSAFDGGFSEEDVFSFLEKRKGKLDGVCITGGEPLMTLNSDFVRKIKEMGFKIKIDTNGSFPDRLKSLIDENLIDYVAMDLKSSPKKYSEVAGVNVSLKNIEDSIKIIMEFGNYEFRTTIVDRFHDAFGLRALGRWINDVGGKKPKRFFLQGFKNEGKFIDESFSKEKNIDEKFLNEMKECVEEYFESVEIRV
jgi:pyruvate formate lyase activating enzyme